MTQHATAGASFPRRILPAIVPVLPGLALTFGLAALALLIQRGLGIAGLSPLIVAMGLGMLVRNTIGPVRAAAPGIVFSLRRILRFAIVLLGFQITVSQVAAVGVTGLAIIVAVLVSAFIFTRAAGRALGVDAKLAELIAAGTAVCGASAVMACNTVTRAPDEDVAYAVACVTVFGSIAMLIMPMLAVPLALDPATYGFWVGSSVHEVAQVVAAAFAQGEVAGQSGTVAKLSRVILLAPLVLSLGYLAARRNRDVASGSAPVPWFVFGFIAMVAVNSLVSLPEGWHERIALATSFMLTVALAAMGLETDIRKLRLKGMRPLLLGAAASLFIALAALLPIVAFL